MRGIIGLCNPFDLYTLDMYHEHFLFGTFHRMLGKHVLREFRLHLEAFRPLEKELGMSLEEMMAQVKTARDFDDRITALTYGYHTAHNYYRKASSALRIDDLKIPALFISSLDDPVVK